MNNIGEEIDVRSFGTCSKALAVTLHYIPKDHLVIEVSESSVIGRAIQRITTVTLKGSIVSVSYEGPENTRNIDPIYSKLKTYADCDKMEYHPFDGYKLLKSVFKHIELDDVSVAFLMASYDEMLAAENWNDFKRRLAIRLDTFKRKEKKQPVNYDFGNPKDRLLSKKDICKMLSITIRTLDLHIKDNTFPGPSCYVFDRPRWTLSDVNTWINSGNAKSKTLTETEDV